VAVLTSIGTLQSYAWFLHFLLFVYISFKNTVPFCTFQTLKSLCSWAWWLMSIILATQEAEIRRITVWLPQAKSMQDPISTNSCVSVAHACHPSYQRGSGWEDCSSRPTQTKNFARCHLNRKSWACGEYLSPHLQQEA
jgi:hypothetical protein